MRKFNKKQHFVCCSSQKQLFEENRGVYALIIGGLFTRQVRRIYGVVIWGVRSSTLRVNAAEPKFEKSGQIIGIHGAVVIKVGAAAAVRLTAISVPPAFGKE